jgi:hypothetical protein
MSRKAAALARIKDPQRTIEIACLLRLGLLQLSDASLTLLDYQIAAQWCGARERVAAVQASGSRRFHRRRRFADAAAGPDCAVRSGTPVDQPDRVAALGCFRAATVMALKRGLRNGSITVDHSFSHRAAEDKLIPAPLWQCSRARFIRGLNLPVTAEKYEDERQRFEISDFP